MAESFAAHPRLSSSLRNTLSAMLKPLATREDLLADTTMELQTKTQRYRLTTSVLGSGSYGKVYIAVRESDLQLVAVKSVNVDVDVEGLSASEAKKEIHDMMTLVIESNLREIAVILYLQTSGVKGITRMADPDVILHHDPDNPGLSRMWSVFEYVSGANMERFLHVLSAYRRKFVDDTERIFMSQAVLSIMKRLTQIVADINEARVVHNDLKPSNIMLQADGSVIVIDFGLSCYKTVRDASGATLPPPAVLVAEQHIALQPCTNGPTTYGYCAPELRDRGHPDDLKTANHAVVDSYSLARIFLELCRGHSEWDNLALEAWLERGTLFDHKEYQVGLAALENLILDLGRNQCLERMTPAEANLVIQPLQLTHTLPFAGLPLLEIQERKRRGETL